MEKTFVYCDRCKKRIATSSDHVKIIPRVKGIRIKWMWRSNFNDCCDYADICKECFNSFNEWLKNAEEKHEQTD